MTYQTYFPGSSPRNPPPPEDLPGWQRWAVEEIRRLHEEVNRRTPWVAEVRVANQLSFPIDNFPPGKNIMKLNWTFRPVNNGGILWSWFRNAAANMLGYHDTGMFTIEAAGTTSYFDHVNVNQLQLSGSQDNAHYCAGELTAFNVSRTGVQKQYVAQSWWNRAGGTWSALFFSGAQTGGGDLPITGVGFAFDTGNIAEGMVRVELY